VNTEIHMINKSSIGRGGVKHVVNYLTAIALFLGVFRRCLVVISQIIAYYRLTKCNKIK
jgi:hypothetical protein